MIALKMTETEIKNLPEEVVHLRGEVERLRDKVAWQGEQLVEKDKLLKFLQEKLLGKE